MCSSDLCNVLACNGYVMHVMVCNNTLGVSLMAVPSLRYGSATWHIKLQSWAGHHYRDSHGFKFRLGPGDSLRFKLPAPRLRPAPGNGPASAT